MEDANIQRIGVLGGTFNPVHAGHLILAQDACELFDLQQVLFVPSAQPPHKPPGILLSIEHRMALLDLAVRDDPRFEVCDIEVARGGVSYTVDTAMLLRARYPAAELCFIVGSDSLPELHLWRSIQQLLTLVRIVSLARPGFEEARVRALNLGLPAPWPERLLGDLRTGHLADISSSDIRHRLAEGLSVRYLVSDAVAMYIAEHYLYTGGN
ncbi:MAG: nicotinate-nucleotide adenylyltransferase [bacterium]